MGIRLLRGRTFIETDGPAAPPVAIVNSELARALFGEVDPVGRQFMFTDADAGDAPVQIVGVVADIRQQRLAARGEPELYLSFRQHPRPRMDIVAKSDRSDANLLRAMREQLWAIRPDLPVRRSVRMRDFVAQSIAGPRFYTLLLGSFAALAVSLAVVGIYGTLAYSVSRRAQELGVRMALGASAGSVLTMVLRRSLMLVTVGVTIGLGGALVVTRMLEAFVFGITPTDAPTMVAGVVIVLAAAAAASTVPACRAARLDPMASLRHD